MSPSSGETKILVRSQDSSIKNGTIFQSFVAGASSSAFTAVIYQPLELIKTRLQIRDHLNQKSEKYFGRAINTFGYIVKTNGVKYLWRGTYPVSRSVRIRAIIVF